MNNRNKSIALLVILLDNHSKYVKKTKELLKEYITSIISNCEAACQIVGSLLQKFKLPQTILKRPNFYIESALFLSYSFSSEVFEEKMN